jgi:conjugal transfer ATP-binding protein TraC
MVFSPSDKGLTNKKLQAALGRERFSDFLPVVAYDPDSRTYLTQDNHPGYMWEVTPIPFGGASTTTVLEGLLGISFPENTVVQYMLFADPYIDPILERYQDKPRAHFIATDPSDPIQQRQAENAQLIGDNISSLVRHISDGRDGIEQLNGIPFRNYRCFIAVKPPEVLSDDLLASLVESLAQFGCRHLPPDKDNGYLALMRRFFGALDRKASGVYDPRKEIRRQIIDPGFPIQFNYKDPDTGERFPSTVKIGDRYARCLTPQALPKTTDMLKMNRIIGGLKGLADDADQITVPYLYTVNFFYTNSKAALNAKAQIVIAQKGAGTLAAKAARVAEDYLWATDKADETPFVRMMPILWTFGRSPEEAGDGVARLKRLWGKEQFSLVEESYLNPVLLPSAMPLGMIMAKQNLTLLDRDFLMPVDAAATFIPLQADFRGAGEPVQLMTGRKGQLLGFDLFDRRLNNHNFLVAAESGAGKSFFLNATLSANYARGAKIRIIDIGGSYLKTTELFGGRFIDVGDERNRVTLNPFDAGKIGDKEDITISMEMAATVLQLMVTSASEVALVDDEVNLLRSATKHVFSTRQNERGIDAAVEFLKNFKEQAEGEDQPFAELLGDKALTLAWNLRPFSSSGDYGRYFNGPSTVHIADDDWVVLELEAMKNVPQLFAVMVMQVLNLVTQDLYLSDRSSQRFILFEEAAAFLKDTMGGPMTKLFASVIEAGFRRARKYSGSMGVVLQSVLDIESFDDVGPVIWENAATKFLLQGKSYEKAAQRKVIPYEGFTLELLKSVRNNRPKYSEVFIDSDIGQGVARLAVDPHSYWMYTSDGKDMARYNRLLKAGAGNAEAIHALASGQEQALYARLTAPEEGYLHAAE